MFHQALGFCVSQDMSCIFSWIILTFTASYVQVLCVRLTPVFTPVLASVTEESFFKYHTSLHDAVKGKLAASQLASISQSLLRNFKQHLNDITTGGEVFNTCFVIQTILHDSSDLKFTCQIDKHNSVLYRDAVWW